MEGIFLRGSSNVCMHAVEDTNNIIYWKMIGGNINLSLLSSQITH